MPRRAPYTRLEKLGQVRPAHVQGMGDVLFKGFQCLAPDCEGWVFVRESEIGPDFRIPCPECAFELVAGGETKFFDYQLRHLETGEIIEHGKFVIRHDEYLAEAHHFKYCIMCYLLKPVEFFGRHAPRASGYQGECRMCKSLYNSIKNQSRISDQHREAAQRRRLYRQMAREGGRLNSREVFEKFEGSCFNCSVKLEYTEQGQRSFHLDHTLPASLLWPMTTASATLLCSTCNNQKHDRWPSSFYREPQLRRLARLTGYKYSLLAGEPQINQRAVQAILEDADGFIEAWIKYPEDIRKVRRLILEHAGVDILAHARHVPDYLRDPGESGRA